MATSEDVGSCSGPYRELGPTEIRIVEIQPGEFDDPIEMRLKVVDIKDEPVYDALSYVWKLDDDLVDTESEASSGAQSENFVDTQESLYEAKIVTDGIFFVPLGANLEAAIRHLRPKNSPPSAACVLWIDAICIDQGNLLERNHQVNLMKDIYASARQVLIWLGRRSGKSDFALQVLRDGRLHEEKGEELLSAMWYVLSRKWFSRVWVSGCPTRPL